MDNSAAVAREAIRDLVARYNYYGDRGRSSDVADLFAEDGVLEHTAADRVLRHAGRTAIAAYLEQIKAQWLEESRGQSTSPHVFHSVGTHVIDLVDDTSARGTCYVTLLRWHGLAEWGSYQDQYVRVGDRWLFASRRAKTEGEIRRDP